MTGPVSADAWSRASVPVRVADVGGWTDTWFGSPGQVCHVAVGPGIEVEAAVVAAGEAAPIDDPLLRAAVDVALEAVGLDAATGIALRITSAVPPGASLGTSAAVLVGIVGAVAALAPDRSLAAPEVARLAHVAETERAGREAGVQDQWAAAMGGVGLLAIGPYPDVRHRAVPAPAESLDELGERLVTVVFGAHDSSAVHAQVINDIVGCSGAAHERARAALRRLSALASEAAATLEAGDVGAWGEVLVASTAAQAQLHPGLVGPAHAAAIEVARGHSAGGWKVNGAGGDGGSLTVLAAPGGAEALAAALAGHDPAWQVLDLAPSSAGLVVTAPPPAGR